MVALPYLCARRIIHQLSGDIPTLCSCLLVSKDWYSLAGPHAFSFLGLKTTGSLLDLIAYLDREPVRYFPRFVEALDIGIGEKGGVVCGKHELMKITRMLPNLQKLALNGISWRRSREDAELDVRAGYFDFCKHLEALFIHKAHSITPEHELIAFEYEDLGDLMTVFKQVDFLMFGNQVWDPHAVWTSLENKIVANRKRLRSRGTVIRGLGLLVPWESIFSVLWCLGSGVRPLLQKIVVNAIDFNLARVLDSFFDSPENEVCMLEFCDLLGLNKAARCSDPREIVEALGLHHCLKLSTLQFVVHITGSRDNLTYDGLFLSRILENLSKRTHPRLQLLRLVLKVRNPAYNSVALQQVQRLPWARFQAALVGNFSEVEVTTDTKDRLLGDQLYMAAYTGLSDADSKGVVVSRVDKGSNRANLPTLDRVCPSLIF